MTDKNTSLKIIEAILFANSDLVDEKDLRKNIPKNINIKKLLNELKNIYKNRGINIYNVKNNWGFRTSPSMSSYLKIQKNLKRKLSKAGIETLAIIAYYQPVTKGEIEKVLPFLEVHKFQMQQKIFQASDIMVDALTNILDKERNRRKAS